MLLPYLGSIHCCDCDSAILWILLAVFCCCCCFFLILCICFILFNGCFYVCSFYRRYSLLNNEYCTGWCKSFCVLYITIEFDRLKRNKRVQVKFHSCAYSLLLLVFSFIPYSSVLQLHSYICYGRCIHSADREWDRIMWIFHWSKNFMNVMQLRATIANFRARMRASVVWIGNFSIHKIKVLAGKPNIIIEWRPLQICSIYKIKVQFLEQKQQ